MPPGRVTQRPARRCNRAIDVGAAAHRDRAENATRRRIKAVKRACVDGINPLPADSM